MKSTSPGLRRYLYEKVFYDTVQRTSQLTGTTIMVSAAKALRNDVEARLVAAGTSMTDPRLGISPVLAAIEGAMSEGVTGYTHPFADTSPTNPAYQRIASQFYDMTGLSRPDGKGNTIPARPGSAGARLPVSPYDPRWSSRSTMKAAGSSLRYIADDDVEQLGGGKANALDSARGSDAQLFMLDEDGDVLKEAGPMLTLDDVSGMSALMPLMGRGEYAAVREWVIGAGRTNSGSYDHSKYMSSAALERATAILESLNEQGIEYRIKRDRRVGQLKAEIVGTKMSVRVAEPAETDYMIGRVYDDGVTTYYSTNLKLPGDGRTAPYTPSPAEAVALLSVAQGKEVIRPDGSVLGAAGTHPEVIWNATAGVRIPTQAQDSYYSDTDKASRRLVGPLTTQDGRPVPRGAMVFVQRSAAVRSVSSTWFGTPAKAEDYLRAAVDSAAANFTTALDVDGLLASHAEHAEEAALDEGAWFPQFNGDPQVAAIQRAYWDVLRGTQRMLLRPGASAADYQERIGEVGELYTGDAPAKAAHDMLIEDLAYVGSARQQVLDHAADVAQQLIGTYDPRDIAAPDGSYTTVRFNPGQVSSRMTSEFGQWRNQADIVAALRQVDIDSGELIGTGFSTRSIRNRLISFDEEMASYFPGIGDIPNGATMVTGPFALAMGDVLRDSIERNGGVVTSLAMDETGVLRYEAQRLNKAGDPKPFTGHIGQIFEPGDHGEIVTDFAGGENYLFAPGYEARIATQRPGANASVEERTLLRGYPQLMAERIQYQIASDMMLPRSVVGEPTSLNGVYSSLYDVRHDVDFIDQANRDGLSSEWVDAILATESRRVRYPSSIASGSTVHAAWRAAHTQGIDPANDNFADPWVLTGARNMAILGQESDGYFDKVMTNGAVNQGITRYLVEGAVVNPDGSITPSDADDRAPLLKLPATALMVFDPFDRQQMSASNLLNASAITTRVGTAMMTLGGWTADDPMVISADFAQRYGLRGVDGQRRSLVVGDKLSDMHGNKGVISLIVDRTMSQSDAAELGIADAVEVFSANPALDVVMSPFSAVSRFNGGSTRELMQSPRAGTNRTGKIPVRTPDGDDMEDELAVQIAVMEDFELEGPMLDAARERMAAWEATQRDLVLPGGRDAVEHAMGTMSFIVTHKDVERGTRVYDDAALAAGRGRKASSQLAWALGSQDCDAVMAEFYGPNNAASTNLREMLVTMGLDMEADGTLRVGTDHDAPGTDRQLFELPPLVRTVDGQLNSRRMRADFGDLIRDRGGDLELPFPLQLPSERPTEAASATSWRLPVLSAHLRSGHDLDDGVSTPHDYTNHYLGVHEAACRYRHAQEELVRDDLSAAARTKYEGTLAMSQRSAQSSFNLITDDLQARRFSGKRNVFRDSVMSSRLPNSATAVWTSDPRLDIDQLGMGPAMAQAMDLSDGDYALVWRDPVLRDAGVRYLRVAVDDRLTGVSINPAMTKCFDGDFDGDSVGVVKLKSPRAQLQARQKLSVEANLLDTGQVLEDMTHPLAMQDSLDVRVAQHNDPQLAQRFEALRLSASDVADDLSSGEVDLAGAWERNNALVGQLSDYYRDAYGSQCGDAVLSFKDIPTHVASVRAACIETGAKGSEAKLADYCRHLGATIGADGQLVDAGVTLHTRAEDEGVMMATAVKSHGTGIAGMYSQRGVKALRGQELKAVLELTQPVTQSVLQSKHDPVEAERKYDTLMGPTRALWKGRLLERTSGPDGQHTWETAKDESHREIQATCEQWKQQFIALYTDPDGLNVSVDPDNVHRVGLALSSNGETTGVMIDIEDPASLAETGRGSTMDRLAYGGEFGDVLTAAVMRENLFDGERNAAFAPHAVRRSAAAKAVAIAAQAAPPVLHINEAGQIEQAEAPAMPSVLTNRDVLPTSDPRSRPKGAGRVSQVAPTVRVPRPAVAQPFSSSFESKPKDDDGYSM